MPDNRHACAKISSQEKNMNLLKFVLAVVLWTTSVAVDKQVIHTSDGDQVVWSVSVSASESMAAF